MLFLCCRGVSSVTPTQGRAFPPNIFASHTQSWNCFLLRLWPMLVRMDSPAPRMDTSPSPLLDGLLVHMVVVASRHQGTNRATRLQMTKEARGGSRVIHGQNCPISAEISQKLDLYPDRPKSGRLCREASQSSTHGARPRSFLPQILLVGSVPGFARAVIHTHSRADTPS